MTMSKKVKRPCIRIFKERETKTGAIKEYIHPKDTVLYAYVRQLSANEISMADSTYDVSNIEFTVNWRKEIQQNMFIEFKAYGDWKLYKITGVDPFEFYRYKEIKIRATPVSEKKEYEEVVWQ